MPQKPLPLKQAIFNRRMLICMATGFASGLPLYILIQLVPAWLRDQGIGLKEIGLFSLITPNYFSIHLEVYLVAVNGQVLPAFFRVKARLDIIHSSSSDVMRCRTGFI